MRYSPLVSLTAVLTFSISTSLDASTVTPGSTAPDVSLITPLIDDWACASPGARSKTAQTRNFHAFLRMCGPPPRKDAYASRLLRRFDTDACTAPPRQRGYTPFVWTGSNRGSGLRAQAGEDRMQNER